MGIVLKIVIIFNKLLGKDAQKQNCNSRPFQETENCVRSTHRTKQELYYDKVRIVGEGTFGKVYLVLLL